MSDAMPSLCPGCFPDRNPDTYEPARCWSHQQKRDGLDDHLVLDQRPLGMLEAGGTDNAAFCALIHGGKR